MKHADIEYLKKLWARFDAGDECDIGQLRALYLSIEAAMPYIRGRLPKTYMVHLDAMRIHQRLERMIEEQK